MPTPVNEQLRNATTRHAIYLTRYSTQTVNRMLALLDRADQDIIKRLRRTNLPGARTPYQRERLEALLRAIKKISHRGSAASIAALRESLTEISAYELDFMARQINAAIVVDVGTVVPAAGTVYSAALSRPMQGKYLRDWFKQLDINKQRAIADSIRLGVVEGETISDIIRRLRGTRNVGYKNGELFKHRRHAESIARTAVNHVVSHARNSLMNANKDLLKGWQYVATLDGRTTDICMSLDGTFYKVGTPGPQPPQHINCRSSMTPITKSWKEMGINRKELSPGQRASMNGQVSAKETYQTWLKKQSAGFQDDVLGRTKGRLFRQGGVTLDRFVDSSGRSYTLAQLARTEAAAFEAIGGG